MSPIKGTVAAPEALDLVQRAVDHLELGVAQGADVQLAQHRLLAATMRGTVLVRVEGLLEVAIDHHDVGRLGLVGGLQVVASGHFTLRRCLMKVL